MSVRILTVDQHRTVLARLVAHARGLENREFRLSEYSNLMLSFLLHELASTDAILALHRTFGDTWFPVTSAYPIARTLFEVDVTAHYISQDPEARTRQYIEWGHVLKKRRMDACFKHRTSPDPSWREGMDLEWQQHWAGIESTVNSDHGRVKSTFEVITANGKAKLFANWSGKTLRQMAEAVGHTESYDIFYSDLSSFAHADIRLANRFLKLPPDGPIFTQRADEGDVAAVFRYAAIFLTCFLELFGRESKLWTSQDVRSCWEAVGV